MTNMECLKLAEEVADLSGVHQKFSMIYFQHRYEHGILTSIRHALEQLNIWDVYREYSREG